MITVHPVLRSALLAFTAAGFAISGAAAASPKPTHSGKPAPTHSAKPTKSGKSGKPTGRTAPTRTQFHPFVMPPGWPKNLVIPKIRVRASVEDIALNKAADYHAPYKWGDVAWYDKSPRPGDWGRSEIFGHLDSTCCPAVFWHLNSLKKGDTIQVQYKTGKPVTFRVMWSGVFWDNKLPTKFMYRPARERGLILMTCAGAFHPGTGYDHKLLVYTRLVLPNGRLG